MEQRYFVSKRKWSYILSTLATNLHSVFILLFTRELACRVSLDTGPIVVSVTPGLCSSDLDIESTTSPVMRQIRRIVMPFICRTPEMGSRTIIHAAISDQIQHGKYLSNCRVEKESEYSLSEEGMALQSRLWVSHSASFPCSYAFIFKDETKEILQNVDLSVEPIFRKL